MYLKIRVTPGQKEESIERKKPDHWFVSVKEPAKQGRANIRVRSIIANELGVNLPQVRLISGHTSPSKIFDIRDTV